MTTSRKKSFMFEIETGSPIPPDKLAYFQTRLRNRLYDFIIGKFLEHEAKGLTRAELARRIDKRPEVITRLLGAPGNWTLDTVSDLLLGIAAEELEPASSSLLNRKVRNYGAHDWNSNDEIVTLPEVQKKPRTPTKSDGTSDFELVRHN